MRKEAKVFVIDYDLLSPLGHGKKEVMKSIHSNQQMNRPISRFQTEGLSNAFAAEVGDISALYTTESEAIKEVIRYDRKLELTVGIYHLMKERLQSITRKLKSERCGVIFGLGIDVTPFELLEQELSVYKESNENPVYMMLKHMNTQKGKLNKLINPLDVSSIYLAEKLGLAAFQKTTLTACAASTQAITYACDSIKRGEADLVIAGGTDSIINQLGFMAFSKLGILAPMGIDENGCMPFDNSRKGTLAGEASGICVLANERTVDELQIEPLFEIIGYGNAQDAYKITAPDPEGKGMQSAIESAILMAGIKGREIDYINMHGTATWTNDPIELKATLAALGEGGNFVPMSSTKDRHGHAIAAAGIQEFAILCSLMEQNCIPSNLNLEKPITASADLVKSNNRAKNIQIGMTNNFAFGGVNSSIIVQKTTN